MNSPGNQPVSTWIGEFIALAAVQTLPPGVYVAMNGMIFDPETTVKDRAGGRFVAAGE